jgi:membrane fusion protein, multidrug efflux system
MHLWSNAKLSSNAISRYFSAVFLKPLVGVASLWFVVSTQAQSTTQGSIGNVPGPKTPAVSAPVQGVMNPPADNIRVLMVPAAETTLVAQGVGRIDRLNVQMGSAFKAGQTLLTFDCSENDAKLRMAQAEYNAAKEQHDAKVRLQSLNAAGDVEVQLAASAAERAKAAIAVSQTQTRLCRVEAPFAGRIVKLHVKQFQGVNTGQPLLELVAGGPLKIKLNAPSRWLQWLRVGTPFEVLIDETGKSYPANVAAINGRVDAVSQSIELEAQVRGSFPDLLPGMSGNARFAVPR